MDKRVKIILFVLLVYTGDTFTVRGNIFTSLFNIFTNRHDDEKYNVAERHKRITSDDGNKAIGLEVHGFRNGGGDEEEDEDVRRSVDEGFRKIWNVAKYPETEGVKKIKVRSIPDDEADISTNTKILEQRATLRIKNNDEGDTSVRKSSKSKFDEGDTSARKSSKSTLRIKNNDVGDTSARKSSKSKFENINSREEKEMSSIKTISSLSVPAAKNAVGDGGSGDDDESTLTEVSNWPKGRYGLPMSTSGCPMTFRFRWKTGFRYQDTEDDGTENQRSDVFHLAANFSEDGISHEFCIKDDADGEGKWPVGKYCIYKRGPSCPFGLKQGFVTWDDENTDNQNDKGGALPEGEYGEDTKIFFCCSTSGHIENQISLPAKKAFFLFAYESIKCQKVLNMKSTTEFIKFDDEDHGNTDHEGGEYPYGIHKFQKDHMLFLCYYEPTKSVKSHNSETPLTANLEEDDIDQESLRQSEEIMKAFMKETGGVEDVSSKRERSKTIIKTIKIPVHNKSSPIATVIGLVLGSIVIGTVIIFITKLVVYKTPDERGSEPKSCDHVEAPWSNNASTEYVPVQAAYNDEDLVSASSDISDNNSASCYTASENDSWSDLEEDDELVEDQLLPDSELKSGLELLFLKQQRHYWNQRRRHEHRENDNQ